MAFADDLENGVTTLGNVAKMNSFKLGAAAVLVCGIGLLRLADAISGKKAGAKDAADKLPAIAPPGQPEAKQ